MIKSIILGLAIAGIAFVACNGTSNKSLLSNNSNNDIKAISQTDISTESRLSVKDGMSSVSIKEIVIAYLQLKNALAEDKSKEAATSGNTMFSAFKNFNKITLTTAQKQTFDDIEDDAKEHAEHIGKNEGNIAHQREHFELLSKDIYDLVKAFGAGQVLYKDFCPMYNNGKGAFWLSETKEIKNPYFGKSMPTCGTIKEEIK